jgi:hypothetical protein
MRCGLREFAAVSPKGLPFPRILPLELFTRDLAADQTRQAKHGFV